ncbi:hypothetical protein R1sor_021192 [Riccia sorocarpa]|uniref:F-box domain-containing protein n=1 Tax=Riccia sorocarpa TaxID=122646 RepID=A0ABD3GK10_9MARC
MGICLGARPKSTDISRNPFDITDCSSLASSCETTIIHCSNTDEAEYSSSTLFEPPLFSSSIVLSDTQTSITLSGVEETNEDDGVKQFYETSDENESRRGNLHILPDEIMVKILASLPVLNLVRNRVVCKRWNQLLTSRGLQEMWARVASGKPPESWTLFYDNNHWEAALYNVGLNRWFALPLNSLIPSQFQIAGTSARGLLCVTGHVRGNFAVGMCNPLSRVFRQLPPLVHNRYHADVSAMDSPGTSAGYKILATGYRVLEMDVTSEIYDSEADCWKVLDNHPRKRKLARYVHDYPVHQSCSSDGKFYFFTSDSDGGFGGGQIVAFDAEDESWFSVESPQWTVLRRSLYWNPCLLARKGCLLLAGGAKFNKNSSSQPGCSSIQIWKLDLEDQGGEWMEVARMPASMFRRFHAQFETFRCFGHGEYLLFISSARPQMIIYELPTQTWSWLPNEYLPWPRLQYAVSSNPFVKHVLLKSTPPLESPLDRFSWLKLTS